MIDPEKLQIDDLTHALHTFEELEKIVEYHCDKLKMEGGGSAMAFLMAIAAIETSSIEHEIPNNVTRFEAQYGKISIAYKRSVLLQEGHKKYGDLSGQSYGPFQILWIVARELGYSGHPLKLWHGAVSLPYVIEKLNDNTVKGAKTIERMAACYNAGPGVLKNPDRWPKNYVRKFLLFYNRYVIRYPK